MKDFNVKIDIITMDMEAISVTAKRSERDSIAYYIIDKDNFSLMADNLKNKLAYTGELFNAVKDFGHKLEQSEAAIVQYDGGWAVRDIGSVIITPKH